MLERAEKKAAAQGPSRARVCNREQVEHDTCTQMCLEFGGWGSLDGCSEISSCCLTSQHQCCKKLAGQGSAVPASSAAASATASTTSISSAVFAATITIVLVCFVEAEQHGYVLLLLLLLVDVKC